MHPTPLISGTAPPAFASAFAFTELLLLVLQVVLLLVVVVVVPFLGKNIARCSTTRDRTSTGITGAEGKQSADPPPAPSPSFTPISTFAGKEDEGDAVVRVRGGMCITRASPFSTSTPDAVTVDGRSPDQLG
jgi:flagellar basal body-associated protein FliL